MSIIKGYGEKLREIDTNLHDQYVTAEPVREKQIGSSVVAHQFLQSIASDAAETGSSLTSIKATAHVGKAGDVVRITSGALEGQEVKVLYTEANFLHLAEKLASIPATGVTFDILRHRYPIVDSSGKIEVTASYVAAPLLFTLDGADQEVVEDTVTPGNNRPLPVKLTGVTGDINITAGDLNVALDSANDSVEIIQSTHDDVNVNANIQIGDADVGALNPVPISDNGGSVTIDNSNIDAALSTLATEASLASVKTAVEIIDNAISGTEMQVDIVAELPAGTQNIGDVDVASLPGTVASDITAIKTAVEIIDNAISGNEMQVDVLTMPAITVNELDVLGSLRHDYSVTSVTTGAYVELAPSTAFTTKQLEIFDSSGQTMVLALSSGPEVDKLYIIPGGNGRIPCAIPASSRVSIKAVSADATVGEIVINFIG